MDSLRQVEKMLAVHEASYQQGLRSLRKRISALHNSTVAIFKAGGEKLTFSAGSETVQHAKFLKGERASVCHCSHFPACLEQRHESHVGQEQAKTQL